MFTHWREKQNLAASLFIMLPLLVNQHNYNWWTLIKKEISSSKNSRRAMLDQPYTPAFHISQWSSNGSGGTQDNKLSVLCCYLNPAFRDRLPPCPKDCVVSPWVWMTFSKTKGRIASVPWVGTNPLGSLGMIEMCWKAYLCLPQVSQASTWRCTSLRRLDRGLCGCLRQ